MLFITGEKTKTKTDNQNDILDNLIYKIAEKDRVALETLYEKTKTSVYGYALSIVKNRADAEDIMHDCYISVYSSAYAYKSNGKPMAWIFTIVKNLCISKLRANQRSEHEPIEDYTEFLPSDTELSNEEKIVLAESLSALTDEERKIVLLHALAGFKHREISEHLSLPLATVLSKYHRAIKKLKKALSEGGLDK